MDKYAVERDGQIDFYNTFLPRINSDIQIEDILSDNNDGVLNGNLLEFKLNIKDLNNALFQCVKYLSALRIKGKPVPAGINIIDLNASTAYYYNSAEYLEYIEKVYIGAASKDNIGFVGGKAIHILHYDIASDAETLVKLLKENNFTKIHIDENCIVGWATSFYKKSPTSRKEDFIGDDTGKHKTIGEIRNPRVFTDYIYPYTGETNVKFNYLMDKLNDTLLKKNLGAFYTHALYAEKSLELVRQAIDRVPDGNDYIILDRCAGTGNLEAGLTDDELSHTIVSTVEYYEYKVLQELLGSKVRHIIPPIETKDTFNAGLVTGADALSKEYINNPIIKQYIDNPQCTIILFENPPYAETTSIEHQKQQVGKTSSGWKNSFVMREMRKDPNISGTTYNDLGNLFIWSGFKYYMRQPTDSYIVYSPVKYWKAQHLINRKFLGGFAFNRKYFHTNIEACIMCAYWGQPESDIDCIEIDAFNIDNNEQLIHCGMLPVKRVHSIYSQKFYDKKKYNSDIEGGIFAEFNGQEAIATRASIRIKPITNDNIIGYLVVKGANFDNPDSCVHLLTVGAYDANGFYMRKYSYLEKLPMFCASRYITYNREWTERARIMKSADGADRFFKDVEDGKLNQFLLKCLLFTCLEMQNHMRTFKGSDGRFYRNELCFDNTNGETIATRDIKSLKTNKVEKQLLNQWNTVLDFAKQTKEYNSSLTYGVYQIFAEIDTSYKDEITGETRYNNLELHSALATLKTLLKEYYNVEIVPILFEYEFLK